MELTIGLDIAKTFFQVHAVDTAGAVIARKMLRRSQVLPFFAELGPSLVGMEACATAHHWAREIAKLGHTVRLMPATYVKPYVKRGKNDANDAEEKSARRDGRPERPPRGTVSAHSSRSGLLA